MTINPEFKTLWEALDEENEERLRLLLKLGLDKITPLDELELLLPKRENNDQI